MATAMAMETSKVSVDMAINHCLLESDICTDSYFSTLLMGSLFSSARTFTLPPMEYHGCVVWFVKDFHP